MVFSTMFGAMLSPWLAGAAEAELRTFAERTGSFSGCD